MQAGIAYFSPPVILRKNVWEERMERKRERGRLESPSFLLQVPLGFPAAEEKKTPRKKAKQEVMGGEHGG